MALSEEWGCFAQKVSREGRRFGKLLGRAYVVYCVFLLSNCTGSPGYVDSIPIMLPRKTCAIVQGWCSCGPLDIVGLQLQFIVLQILWTTSPIISNHWPCWMGMMGFGVWNRWRVSCCVLQVWSAGSPFAALSCYLCKSMPNPQCASFTAQTVIVGKLAMKNFLLLLWNSPLSSIYLSEYADAERLEFVN